MATKTNLDSVCDQLRHEYGFSPNLTDESYDRIIECGFRRKTLPLAFAAAQVAFEEQPLTLRGVFYRTVSAGILPSTATCNYVRLGRLMTKLRESGIVPFEWIVDNIRETLKPSSWSGLEDFVDTVKTAYRKDYWASMPHYVHIICEKDAIAGVLQPVTEKYDVSLSVVRGYGSVSYMHSIAATWQMIDKPIFCYYLGDFDPSGFDLERDARSKLVRYSGRYDWYGLRGNIEEPWEWPDYMLSWQRLAVLPGDFETHDLLPLEVKSSDTRAAKFVEKHGTRCAELDAIPASNLRDRIEAAIKSHIQSGTWARLQTVEKAEKETFDKTLATLQP